MRNPRCLRPSGSGGHASPFRAEFWALVKRLWPPPRRLRDQDRLQALPDPERPAPSECVPAILAPAPSVVLERDPGGSAHPARPGRGYLNAAPSALVGDLGFESLGRLLRVPSESQPGQVIPFREDVLSLPQENTDFRGADIVGFRFLQDRLARIDDRLGLLDLGPAELHRAFDLTLLALHREPLRAFEEIARLPVLADGDRGAGGLMEPLRLLHVRADVPREGNVIGHEADRFLNLANPTEPGVLGPLAGLDKTLPRGGQTVPIEIVASA